VIQYDNMVLTKEMIYRPITDFLEENDFNKIDDYNYSNDKCDVIIVNDVDNPFYRIIDNDKENLEHDVYIDSHDLSLYWLIGYLTYYKLMNKNYKQLNHG